VRYVDHHGRDKRSRYWAMHPEDPDGPGAPDDEVDELRWLALDRARSQLSYEHDGVVLDALERLDPA
jgi:hypothetical protein